MGVGSFTYQFNTRDTLGFAAKGAWFEVRKDNRTLQDPSAEDTFESYNIYKDPITDDGTKKSLKGLLCVKSSENGDLVCLTEQTWEQENQGWLQTIYEDGKFYNQTTLEEVRNRLK